MENSKYRPISSYAVAAYCIAPLALAGFAIPEALAVSGIVLILAIIASIQIYFYEYVGRRFVITACVAAIFTAFEIPYWHHRNYHSETEPGYHREDFEKLARSEELLRSLVGHSLCLKGQVVFGSSNYADEQTFLFAPRVDGFGTVPILRVELMPNTRWRTASDRVAVSGVLAEVDPGTPGGNEPKFVLRNAFVRRSRTLH